MFALIVRSEGSDSIKGRNPCFGLISTLITGPIKCDLSCEMNEKSATDADLAPNCCIEQ